MLLRFEQPQPFYNPPLPAIINFNLPQLLVGVYLSEFHTEVQCRVFKIGCKREIIPSLYFACFCNIVLCLCRLCVKEGFCMPELSGLAEEIYLKVEGRTRARRKKSAGERKKPTLIVSPHSSFGRKEITTHPATPVYCVLVWWCVTLHIGDVSGPQRCWPLQISFCPVTSNCDFCCAGELKGSPISK